MLITTKTIAGIKFYGNNLGRYLISVCSTSITSNLLHFLTMKTIA